MTTPTTRPPGPPIGARVELLATSDPYTRLRTGSRGTVTLVDSLGTVHVAWDTGSILGLVAEAGDRFRVIDTDEDLR